MAANIVRTVDDGTIPLTVGGAEVATGKLKVHGKFVVLYKQTGAAAAEGHPVVCQDVIANYSKLSTDVIAEGDPVYFDAANDRLTVTPGLHLCCGIAVEAAGNGTTDVQFLLMQGLRPAAGEMLTDRIDTTGIVDLAADGVDSGGGDAEVTLTGATVGQRVKSIRGQVKANTGDHSILLPAIGTDFEAEISVADKIVQLQAAGDLSANTYVFELWPKTS